MEEIPSSEDALFEARETGFAKDPSLVRARKGADYQMKIAALFVISSLKEEGIRYNLSMEDKSAGKFDDVVIRVARKEDSMCWFIQAKHKEIGAKINLNDLLFAQKGDFYLRKYFQSFLEIKSKVGYKQTAVGRFIIYTPAAMDFDDDSIESGNRVMMSGSNCLRFKKVLEDQDLLHINKYSVFQLQSDECIRSHIGKSSPDVGDDDIEDFLQHLRFAVEQPTKDEMNDILVEKTTEANTGCDPEDVTDRIFKRLDQWFIARTAQCKYFTESDVAEVMLNLLKDTYKKSVSLDNVTFSECSFIGDFLNSKQDVLWVCTSNLKLCCCKLLQFIRESFNGSSLASYFEDLKKVRHIVLPYLPLNANSVIVVVVETSHNIENDYPVLNSLISKFIAVRHDNEGAAKNGNTKVKEKENVSKLLLVSTDFPTKNMKEMLGTQENLCYVEDSSYCFTSLSRETQSLIMDKSVNFQGFPVTLRELCSEDSTPSFTPEDITRLVEEENIPVGRKVTTVYQKTMTYVPRTLYAPHILREECLHNLEDELFVVLVAKYNKNIYGECTDSSPDEMEYQFKITGENVYLALHEEEAQQTFASLCCSFPERNIHKLNQDNVMSISVLWLQTHGSVYELQKFAYRNVKFGELEIEDKPFSVIAAEPGMGKSSLLSQRAEAVKGYHRDWWVVNLSLKDISEKCLNFNPDVTIKDLTKSLSGIFLEGETSLSKILFQHSLEETGKFILLLDGYDEIGSQEEREKILQVLQRLHEHSRGHVIITTRLHFKEELEKATSTIAYRLKPLNKTQQEKLLTEIWIKNLDVSSNEEKSERVHVYAREIVRDFSKKVDERIGSFIGIPLQVTLLAEVCEKSCALFCDEQPRANISVELPYPNLLSLYTIFENMKYEKFLRSEAIPGSSYEKYLNHVCEEHRSVCTEKAIDYLLPDNSFVCDCCMRSAFSKPHFLDEQHILRIGILHKCEGTNISFIHRTFAEYFFALRVAQIVTKGNLCKKFMELLRTKLCSKEYEVIRLFADNVLAKSRIHIAALTNDTHALEEELDNGTYINKTDALGRTACHLAVAYGHVEAFEVLMIRGCDLQAKENVANFTPSELAVAQHNWKMCSLLLVKGITLNLSGMEKELAEWLCREGRAAELQDIIEGYQTISDKMLRDFDNFVSIALGNSDVEMMRVLLNCAKHEHYRFNLRTLYYRYGYHEVIISNGQINCWHLLMEFSISERRFDELRNVLLMVNDDHLKQLFSDKADSLENRNYSLKELVLLAIFSEYDYLMAIIFDRISLITKDLSSYILQPFESHKTLVHFATRYQLHKAVRRLFTRMQEEEADIFHVLFPENVQEEPLIHMAVNKLNRGLLSFFIDFIRENEGNVAFYLSQQDSDGRTPLCRSLYLEDIKLIVVEMKRAQSPIFEASLLHCTECNNKGTFFDFLFERIMAHGNNLLACIMRRDCNQKTA